MSNTVPAGPEKPFSPSEMDRRGFLKALAALGIITVVPATALAGCAPKDGQSQAAQSESFDLIVVGAGGAGLAAAITARENGVEKILILESEPVNGGNTNFSSSGMNASETKFQKAQSIDDTNELFIDDTYKGGKQLGEMPLIEHLCNNSAEAIEWLEGIGIKLDNITLTAGSTIKRCHRPTDGSAVGKTLVPGLVSELTKQSLKVKNGYQVTDIVMEGGKAVGVKDAGGTVYHATAIVISTGGFGANYDMITKYRPDLKDYVSTNAAGTQGDGMRMAQAAGAELVDMDQIQIHPTVDQGTGSLIAEGIRGGGAILVNVEGNRFIDELKTRDVVSAAELEQPQSFAYVVYDQEVFDKNKDAASYEKAGLSIKADTIEALAEKLGIDPVALVATVNAYNAAASEGAADPFERTQSLKALTIAPFYACKVAPGIHHCMGGIKINTKNEVLDSAGKPLAGLYAAGETTGGIHGANRLGGNAVCDIMVNGRQAGRSAAAYIKG
ncbi:MAG: flavocytochrome c [Coriobacteriales bacterium]|jgi:fumarate reductase flavoprotein subunit|nr:flavocytochrome c [Coriobacteriales bacterium]